MGEYNCDKGIKTYKINFEHFGVCTFVLIQSNTDHH